MSRTESVRKFSQNAVRSGRDRRVRCKDAGSPDSGVFYRVDRVRGSAPSSAGGRHNSHSGRASRIECDDPALYTRAVTAEVALTGDDLSLEDVWAVAVERRPAAALSDDAREQMRAARRVVERAAHGSHEHTYGVNTGFGRFVSKQIPEELTEELQLRLLRSHACGVGEPYPDSVVRAAMLLRANALAKGNSGARVETVELLLECLNRGVLPFVPARGSVGASGDLAPLAHLALPLVGEGLAWVEGELVSGGEALSRVGLEPVRLRAKEGLSLINGTQFMAAQATLALVRARRLARIADCACALSLEALQGSRNSFIPQVHALRPLRGQGASARNVIRLLEESAINESHRWCDKVQDAYSLRCAPQVHGASRDLLDYVEYTVTVELNAATDNPLVLVEEDMLVSAGNFHGQPLAFALDALAMAVAELASISERRLERLVNPNLSDGLPAFLTSDGGLNSGFMIPQYVSAALVSENKSLCHPASVDSIPTSAGQEDHVSMGNAAGLKAWQVVANSERALAIELLAGAQAIEFLAPLEPGRGAQATYEHVRTLSPRLRDDRSLSSDIEAVADSVRDGSLLAAVEAEIGELE
jgi:histidine ammonia-lyase